MEMWNRSGKKTGIAEALGVTVPEKARISLVGAGGKTSLLFAWARELAAGGRRTVVTTTTHMAVPAEDRLRGISCVLREGKEGLKEAGEILDREGIVFVALPDPEKPGKVKSWSPENLAFLHRICDVMLVEADGSRRCPVKWPAPWEPVVLPGTDITVAVAGLSALGRPLADCAYRWEDLAEELGLPESGETILTEDILVRLLASEKGARKGSLGEFRVYLNQADSGALQACAGRVAGKLAERGISSAWGCFLRRREEVALILLAAGNSRRFGSNKLLHVMEDGRLMIDHILRAVSGIPFRRKILVTRYPEAAALAEDCQICFNEEPDRGLSHSMQLGIEAAGDAPAYLFCVCDMPWLSGKSIRKLLEAYESGQAGILSLAWQQEPRQPNLFTSDYREALMAIRGDRGGRQVIREHRWDCCLVEAASEQEVTDMDTPLQGPDKIPYTGIY